MSLVQQTANKDDQQQHAECQKQDDSNTNGAALEQPQKTQMPNIPIQSTLPTTTVKEEQKPVKCNEQTNGNGNASALEPPQTMPVANTPAKSISPINPSPGDVKTTAKKEQGGCVVVRAAVAGPVANMPVKSTPPITPSPDDVKLSVKHEQGACVDVGTGVASTSNERNMTKMFKMAVYDSEAPTKSFECEMHGMTQLEDVSDFIIDRCTARAELRGVKSSNIWYVEGTLYADDRLDGFDYATPLTEFLRKAGSPVRAVHLNKSPTKVYQLNPIIGKPYVFLHNGDCEHIVIFILQSVAEKKSGGARDNGDKRPRKRRCKDKQQDDKLSKTAPRVEPIQQPQQDTGVTKEEELDDAMNFGFGRNQTEVEDEFDASEEEDDDEDDDVVDDDNNVDNAKEDVEEGDEGSDDSVDSEAEIGVGNKSSPETEGLQVGTSTKNGSGLSDNGVHKPRELWRRPIRVFHCDICKLRMAAKFTVVDPLADKVPFHYCLMCFNDAHYTRDGKLFKSSQGLKVYDHEQLPPSDVDNNEQQNN